MYFIIKYNVFNKYIINVTTTEINTCKNSGMNLTIAINMKEDNKIFWKFIKSKTKAKESIPCICTR
jgi:hypothetical protein